jgi:uncharacterized protein (TIGR02284 family)
MPDQMISESRITDALKDLSTVCRDGQEGYRGAAAATTDAELKAMFDAMARQREQEADALDQLIRDQGGQVGARSGSFRGYIHRLFVSMRAAITSNNRAAVLAEVVRGESYAEAAFDRVKRLDLLGHARDVVQRLHDSVKQSRDKVRGLVEAEGGWTWNASLEAGQRSLDTVDRYVSDNPRTSSVIALGAGFLLGVLAVKMSRPSRSDDGQRQRRRTGHRYAYRRDVHHVGG